jgi:hypothetical protein
MDVMSRSSTSIRLGEVLDAHRLGLVLADPVGGRGDLCEVAVGGGDLAQQPAVLPGEQPVVQFAFDQRRQHRGGGRFVEQPDQARERIGQGFVEDATAWFIGTREQTPGEDAG